MTLRALYEKAKKQPTPKTPAAAFIHEICTVTKKSEIAVRRWVSGDCIPDALTQDVLAKHFNTTPEQLFPRAK